MKKNIPDFFKLFIRREGRVLLGRKMSSLWLLTLVLTATFFAIAFANGSLNYLNYKMNDPFINWVDIKNPTIKDPDITGVPGLKSLLDAQETRSRYHCVNASYEYEYSFNYFGRDDTVMVYLKNRFFDLDNNRDLIGAILDKENRIEGYTKNDVKFIDKSSMGVIITQKALTRLGYMNDAPAYLDMACFSPGASELGIGEFHQRSRVPVPVLGVVRRLPGNADVVGFNNLYGQRIVETSVLNMHDNKDYASSLCYFVPDDIDAERFFEELHRIVEEEIADLRIDNEDEYQPREMFSYKNRVVSFIDGFPVHHLGFYKVCPEDGMQLDPLACCRVDKRIKQAFPGVDIHRLFEYNYRYTSLGEGHYLSIQFSDLSKLNEFIEEVANKCGVEIEMSQINAKENFKSVSAMAITLSVVMVLFAIVCILLFIVNLLRSYFQKIKRNIGTFKAFGMSNQELQSVYLVIVLALVGIALVISLLAVSVIQWVLPLLGIVKADGFGYLSLWSCNVINAFPPLITLASGVVVLAAVALTVVIVTKRLLSATPGDLIYDR